MLFATPAPIHFNLPFVSALKLNHPPPLTAAPFRPSFAVFGLPWLSGCCGLQGPDSEPSHFTDKIVINDFPQQARWKITQKSTVNEVYEMTGVAIITKGKQAVRHNISPTSVRMRENARLVSHVPVISHPRAFSRFSHPYDVIMNEHDHASTSCRSRRTPHACVLFLHRRPLDCLCSSFGVMPSSRWVSSFT